MYLVLIFLVLVSSCVTGLFSKHIGSLGSIKISIVSIFISLIFSVCIFYEVALCKSPVYIELFYWIDSETLNIKWSFIFDSLTVLMSLVVTFVSFLVHLYSVEYMSNDPHVPRFLCYLSLFTFFMLVLITADNFLQLFLGWEGVGLCSYLLINFWYTRIQANKAAIKAMIINRIGDFCLIIGVLILFLNFKTLDFSVLSVLIPFFLNNKFLGFNLLDIIGLFLFFGAMGKSAQLGLHTWLPDAMEGPTPVSALIHAATMVTAGIFLVIRVSFLYEYVFNVLELLTFIGILTSFVASSTGLAQNDLKKVIAYSTCSQLGYMIFSCGLSNYSASVFHLTNHAFFKALLFLSAGSIIHSVFDEQDVRKMGGLITFLPFTYVMIFIGSLALVGFPFFTGFYSKDLILESALSNFSFLGYFSYIFGTIGAFLTSFYSTRLLFLTFLSKPNGFRKIICYSQDSGNIIKFVLGCLSIPSIFVGYYSKDLIAGIGSSFFFNSIFNNINFFIFEAELIPLLYKILPIVFSISGLLAAFIVYSFKTYFLLKLKLTNIGLFFYNFLNKKWYFDKVYNNFFSQFFFKLGYSSSYKFLDRGIFEIIGPTGIAIVVLKLSLIVHKLQTNFLYHITMYVFISITFLLILKFFIIKIYFLNILVINVICILMIVNKIMILKFIKHTAYIVNSARFNNSSSYLLSNLNSHIINYPTPINLTYAWSFGSLAGICLILQIVTGIYLATHYTPNMKLAYNSIQFIMRDVPYGWFWRYAHANGASMFFIVVYAHLFRGLYYGSYMEPREYVWCSGVVLLLLMMGTAFTGYVLPWGQMSFWGATVITSMVTILPKGQLIAEWIWGGYVIKDPTLRRFFIIHYLLPFFIVAVSVIHLILLHKKGSNNPLGTDYYGDNVSFFPYFILKDSVAFSFFLMVYGYFIFYNPEYLNHPDNYVRANPIKTPLHVVPEWYFLVFYAILRGIPHKTGGILAMFGSIVILLVIPFTNTSIVRSTNYRPFFKLFFWLFVADCAILLWVGGMDIKYKRYLFISQVATIYYYLFFILFLPLSGKLEHFLLNYIIKQNN